MENSLGTCLVPTCAGTLSYTNTRNHAVREAAYAPSWMVILLTPIPWGSRRDERGWRPLTDRKIPANKVL